RRPDYRSQRPRDAGTDRPGLYHSRRRVAHAWPAGRDRHRPGGAAPLSGRALHAVALQVMLNELTSTPEVTRWPDVFGWRMLQIVQTWSRIVRGTPFLVRTHEIGSPFRLGASGLTWGQDLSICVKWRLKWREMEGRVR